MTKNIFLRKAEPLPESRSKVAASNKVERIKLPDAQVLVWSDFGDDDHTPASSEETKVAAARTLYLAQADVMLSDSRTGAGELSREQGMWIRQYLVSSMTEHLDLVYGFEKNALDAEYALQTRITLLGAAETLASVRSKRIAPFETPIIEPKYSMMLNDSLNVSKLALEFIFSDKRGEQTLHLVLLKDFENDEFVEDPITGEPIPSGQLSLTSFGDALDQGLDVLVRRLAQARSNTP